MFDQEENAFVAHSTALRKSLRDAWHICAAISPLLFSIAIERPDSVLANFPPIYNLYVFATVNLAMISTFLTHRLVEHTGEALAFRLLCQNQIL